MFCIIPELVLQNQLLTSDCKIVVGILNSMRKANAYYWGSNSYLSLITGIKPNEIGQIIDYLIQVGAIDRSTKGLMLSIDPETEPISLKDPQKPKPTSSSINSKLKNMLDSGWVVVLDNDKFVQLLHPDKSGMCYLSKFE